MEAINPGFMSAVQALSTWKFFPQGAALGILAADLAIWCEGHVDRAWWFVGQKDQFDEYPGPKTIKGMIKDRFQPAGAIATYKSTVPAVLPAARCQTCRDTGVTLSGGRTHWCTCAIAIQMQQESPKWVEFCNQFRHTPPSKLKAAHRAEETHRKLGAIMGGTGDEL